MGGSTKGKSVRKIKALKVGSSSGSKTKTGKTGRPIDADTIRSVKSTKVKTGGKPKSKSKPKSKKPTTAVKKPKSTDSIRSNSYFSVTCCKSVKSIKSQRSLRHRPKSATSTRSLVSMKSIGFKVDDDEFSSVNTDSDSDDDLEGGYQLHLELYKSTTIKMPPPMVVSSEKYTFDFYNTPIYSSPDDTSSLKGHYVDNYFIFFDDFQIDEKFQDTYKDDLPVGAFTVLDQKTGTMIVEKICLKDRKLGIHTTFRSLRAVGLNPAVGEPASKQTISQMATYCRQTVLLRLVIFDVALIQHLKFSRFPFLLVSDDQLLDLKTTNLYTVIAEMKSNRDASSGSAITAYPKFTCPGQSAILPTPPPGKAQSTRKTQKTNKQTKNSTKHK